jgi:cobalt-zinc-cadmium efflux system membrane fusion protein
MNQHQITWVLAGLLLVSGCTKGTPSAPTTTTATDGQEPGGHKDESEEHAELPRRVRLTAQVIAAAGIKTAPTTAQSLPATVDLTGEIAADPDHAARITARTSGRIVEVHFKEGDRVQAGALLVVLESADISRTRAELRSGQARAQAAQQNAARLEALSRAGLAAGQEVATAQAEAAALTATAAAAQRTLVAAGAKTGEPGLARLEVRAPIAGSILQRNAIQGQTVEVGHLFADLADLQTAYFVGRLFEKHLARVHIGAKADVRLNAYPGEVFQGTVERIGQQLDPLARTVVARIAIKNRNELLKVGLFGKARVTVPDATPQQPQLVVPLDAVVRVAQDDVAFVRQPDGHFEIHPLKLGRAAAGQVEVISGLRAGEQVVVQGAFSLKSVFLKNTFGEEE